MSAQWGAGVLSDVESFVFREGDGGGVLHGIPGHFLTVDIQHTSAALAQAGTIRLEVELDGVLAGLQLGPLSGRRHRSEGVYPIHVGARGDRYIASVQLLIRR